MLLAHKVQLYPTAAQAEYLRRCCGARRYAYNALLAYFKEPGVKWSKAAAYAYFIAQVRQPWMTELTSRAPRNAIDDLDTGFKHFFRRVKAGQRPGFPTFHKHGVDDSFSLREKPKFAVSGRKLRLEKAPGLIRMRQALRFEGTPCSVTVSHRAGKFYAAIVVETNYSRPAPSEDVVGVDFGVSALATFSNGEVVPANQKLKANLRRLKRKQRNLSRKQPKSNRRAKAKLAVAKLHKRVADQRRAVLHETSDTLTRRFKAVIIEDLAVKNMVNNRKVSRAISDAGLGTLRAMVEYKAVLRGCDVVVAPRFYPSSKTCSACGEVKTDLALSERIFRCEHCDLEIDRDLNAARNLESLHTLTADSKRAQEFGKTASNGGTNVDGAKMITTTTDCVDYRKHL